MNSRRLFLGQMLSAFSYAKGNNTPAQVAITMDDFNLSQAWPETPAKVNSRLLALFDRRKIRIALFVAARNVEEPSHLQLLKEWSRAGHIIGNHTYSHFSLPSAEHSLTDFEADILRAERILSPVENYRRLFRFPALKEGNTRAQRDGMRAFLDEHGYRNGYVTIDASDWYYQQRLSARLHAVPGFSTARYEPLYVAHIRDRSLYYDHLARQVLGRSPRHTLLVHYSYLNANYLESVLDMYSQMDWQLIDADDAYRDPIAERRPDILPAGESLIWALAKETGRFDSQLRYPGEDGDYEKPKLDRSGL